MTRVNMQSRDIVQVPNSNITIITTSPSIRFLHRALSHIFLFFKNLNGLCHSLDILRSISIWTVLENLYKYNPLDFEINLFKLIDISGMCYACDLSTDHVLMNTVPNFITTLIFIKYLDLFWVIEILIMCFAVPNFATL